MQNAERRMQNEIIRLLSNSQIPTNIVEKSGWRPLISFGSTFPSVADTFPCRCSHSLKSVRKLSLMPNKGREHRVGTPCEGSIIHLSGKFLEFLKPFFKKVLSGCGQSPRPSPLWAHDLLSFIRQQKSCPFQRRRGGIRSRREGLQISCRGQCHARRHPALHHIPSRKRHIRTSCFESPLNKKIEFRVDFCFRD